MLHNVQSKSLKFIFPCYCISTDPVGINDSRWLMYKAKYNKIKKKYLSVLDRLKFEGLWYALVINNLCH